MTSESAKQAAPRAFVSYSWDTPEHKSWTKTLATRLRADGVDVTLDQWRVDPGDQLPKFMETAIRENSYVLIICTPNYKKKSDERRGGVGYEGDIMTGEVLTEHNDRKFIPVLRSGTPSDAMPSWLGGKYSINLCGDPYSEEGYQDLLLTLHNQREQAPPIGKAPELRIPSRDEPKKDSPTKGAPSEEFVPIKIRGVLADEAGRPKNDGTRGSALYAIPFKLSRVPSDEWDELFIQAWDHPPQWTTSHRPGIARVQGDRIILDGTTIEEVRDTHRATLRLVVDAVNDKIAQRVGKRCAAEAAKTQQEQLQQENLHKIADDLEFD
ncbi:MAG: toll/interleukin-1 receptor domain-containing protein [Planctomycetes bacterium]|nr:toll/interleukin-1 receptor domain-containing protein [Planctomycetota bacterium]